MAETLLKLFVKNYQETENSEVRASYGRLSGLVGIICNLLLSAGKLLIGTLSGAVSITADAVNNLSDASSSIVTLVGFKLAAKPADDEHPYGHARIEYFSGLIVAVIILVLGVELCKTSFVKILHPETVQFSVWLVVVLLASIAVKLWLAGFYRKLGKKIGSTTLMASAADSRNDVVATSAVLLSCIVGKLTSLKIDGYMGLLVALFIIWSGLEIAKDTINPLLGEAPDETLVHAISKDLTANPNILGIHDFIIHDYGPGRRFASVHVEMDSAKDVLASHDLIDELERACLKNHNVNLTIHFDPVVTSDQELRAMKKQVQEILHKIDSRMSLHDFRMVRGPHHTNLIFDLVVPHEWFQRQKELKGMIDECVQLGDTKYYTVITFDEEAFNM